MPARTETQAFTGEAGLIDCAIDWPAAPPRGWALVLHPHSLQGGARDNKVVTTLARACVTHGLAALRPDVRGDPKSVVEGKSGTVGVDVGGRRIIKKKTTKPKIK